jgi:mono/diheme cytochrome c family protein
VLIFPVDDAEWSKRLNFQQSFKSDQKYTLRLLPQVFKRTGWRLSLLALTLVTLSACTFGIDPEQMIQDGEPLYVTNCGRCHQVDGSGAEGLYPPLAGNPVVTLHDPAPMIDVIVNGRGSMPAFRGALDSEDAASVISYIRNAWGNEASIVLPKQVQSN